MSNTSSKQDRDSSALKNIATYESKETYQARSISASTTAQTETPTPRRVISESSFKARARNNINY